MLTRNFATFTWYFSKIDFMFAFPCTICNECGHFSMKQPLLHARHIYLQREEIRRVPFLWAPYSCAGRIFLIEINDFV